MSASAKMLACFLGLYICFGGYGIGIALMIQPEKFSKDHYCFPFLSIHCFWIHYSITSTDDVKDVTEIKLFRPITS